MNTQKNASGVPHRNEDTNHKVGKAVRRGGKPVATEGGTRSADVVPARPSPRPISARGFDCDDVLRVLYCDAPRTEVMHVLFALGFRHVVNVLRHRRTADLGQLRNYWWHSFRFKIEQGELIEMCRLFGLTVIIDKYSTWTVVVDATVRKFIEEAA